MFRMIASRPQADVQGTVAIEYAIILPVFLLLMLGIMDLGRLFWAYTTLASASEAAARCFAIQATSCTTASATQSYAVSQAWGLNVNASAFTVTTQACGAQVSATYVFSFVIPWVGNSITLNAAACYPQASSS